MIKNDSVNYTVLDTSGKPLKLKYEIWMFRLPDLRKVIVTDSKQSGMLHVDDVMQAAESQHHRHLNNLQRILSPDDPINIQFTSVRHLHSNLWEINTTYSLHIPWFQFLVKNI